MYRRLLPIILILLTAVLTAADADGARPRRNSKTVRQEQRQNSKKMERTRKQISSNTAEIQRQLADLQRIEADIAEADSRIGSLRHSADSLNSRIRVLSDSLAATKARTDALKSSYASSLRSMRSQRQLSSATAFIFSSHSFSEARRRMRYLRELGDWQKEKATQLKQSLTLLNSQKEQLDSARARLTANMNSLNYNRRKLEQMQNRSDIVVGKLRRQGKRLESALAQQQEQARRLDQELNRIIEEEARQAAEAERKRKAREAEERRKREQAEQAAQPSQPDKGKKPEQKTKPAAPKPSKPAPKGGQAAAGSFAAAKGKLPMPVSGSAVIVSDFGRHTHKDLAKVQVQNNGIDIETTPGSYAVAVYPGTVTMVIVMEGYHNVVLVRHGEYLTVYAGLADLAVRKGQEVKAGQALGTVWSDPDDKSRTRLHFEIRHEKDKLDPAEWLR